MSLSDGDAPPLVVPKLAEPGWVFSAVLALEFKSHVGPGAGVRCLNLRSGQRGGIRRSTPLVSERNSKDVAV